MFGSKRPTTQLNSEKISLKLRGEDVRKMFLTYLLICSIITSQVGQCIVKVNLIFAGVMVTQEAKINTLKIKLFIMMVQGSMIDPDQ